ncbi:unnamed protein product [Rangifer tarandus platyrhynchus]|uniref:Uncharacterized protein n=2 Tax=Rangifer tarandus platyrhynchus TaxID=3082113 RepID=A0ACB1KEL2_RANTA|nr:unnamed protein product [Rangifer tarandus platyrhynchus]
MHLSQGTNYKAGRCLLSAMPADLPQTFIAYVGFTQMEAAGQLYPPHGPTHARMLTWGGVQPARPSKVVGRLSTPSGPPPPGFCPPGLPSGVKTSSVTVTRARVPTQLAHAKIEP